METRCLKASDQAIAEAGALLRQGCLVAFPTETVYGLGADALNARAVRDIFAAKGRPADNPLIVHVADRAALEPLCRVPDIARRLMDAFWPGPLTLLLPKTDMVPDITTAGLKTVAVRMPAHPVALSLIRAAGMPIAAPSANLSGRPSPTTAAHVLEDMGGRVPMILDGGECLVGVESTVLDLSGGHPVVLRPGAVTMEMVDGVVGGASVADSVMRPLKEGESAPSPGMRHRHYAPKGRMTVFLGAPEQVAHAIKAETTTPGAVTFVLCRGANLPLYKGMNALSLGDTPEETARLLFSLLRRMDEEGAVRILAEGWPPSGEALAVMNRMARAAAFDIRNV